MFYFGKIQDFSVASLIAGSGNRDVNFVAASVAFLRDSRDVEGNGDTSYEGSNKMFSRENANHGSNCDICQWHNRFFPSVFYLLYW